MKTQEKGKTLYSYQQEDLNRLFDTIQTKPAKYNLLYQLPTGGGKTVIFSEIARRYVKQTGKKVLILTHRIELSAQTCRMLSEFGVKSKVIDSKVKTLDDQDDYDCFVAMVETLNNRLNDGDITFENIGLVIIDEAHYNSFRKLFQFFDNCFMLGVTATPLSSNKNLPMKDIYDELFVGHSISYLVQHGFLSEATTYTYDVGLGTLKIGINGDYTVKSSERLYSNLIMQSKLLTAYEERAKNTKTLIFNAGVQTSVRVYHNFRAAGYPIRHVDSTTYKTERKETLQWFKKTPGAILSSVGILTTGFDEPTVQTIILNRATKSPVLYYQMIGRGSRVLPTKKTFDIIDLGNNVARFGPWAAELDWQLIFRNPNYYLESLVSDDDIERQFKYLMPKDVRTQFNKTKEILFDVEAQYDIIKTEGKQSSILIDRSILQHLQMVIDNSEDLMQALTLSRLLEDDITDRVRRYCYCISNSTRNYRDWVEEEYNKTLRRKLMMEY